MEEVEMRLGTFFTSTILRSFITSYSFLFQVTPTGLYDNDLDEMTFRRTI